LPAGTNLEDVISKVTASVNDSQAKAGEVAAMLTSVQQNKSSLNMDSSERALQNKRMRSCVDDELLSSLDASVLDHSFRGDDLRCDCMFDRRDCDQSPTAGR
jgi:hypothetical protein